MNFTIKKNTLLTNWLILSLSLIIGMIILGGVTRLTGSGLSIVEWKPISGVIPPITDDDWLSEFSKYQNSLEYKQQNFGMNIVEFKSIFWLEFIHRLVGRFTGLFYLLPLLYFYFTRRLSRKSISSHFIILTLFCLQGFMGWYMVKSGLVDQPFVSHFRLATHLILAVVIYSLLFWQLMRNDFDILVISNKTSLCTLKFFCLLELTIIYIQIFLGALVAGLHGGLIYNTFPLMGDTFIPLEISSEMISWNDLSNPVFIQFIHRICAYILTILIGISSFLMLKSENRILKKVALYSLCVLLIQILAGIFTLIYSVPIGLALIHQIGSIALLSCLLWGYFLLKGL